MVDGMLTVSVGRSRAIAGGAVGDEHRHRRRPAPGSDGIHSNTPISRVAQQVQPIDGNPTSQPLCVPPRHV
jgi:hypothetical protein